MAEYTVTIYEQITHTVQVDAESEQEAYEKAHNEIAETDTDYVSDAEFTGYWNVEEGW